MGVRSVLVGVLLGQTLLSGACSAGSPQATGPATSTLRWEGVALPDGLSAVTLATAGRDVVIGARGPDRPHPHLLIGSGPSALREIPLTPRSPYAFEATWFQVATGDGRIEAVGGARGGAHGNHRWTTWSGDESGVAELEQPFGVFGSYGAGDLVGVAYAGRSPVVLGAWQSELTGMDVATWTRTGDRWARQPSTGTRLGSRPEALAGARAIASHGDGLILSGSVTRLSPGSVRVDPAVWTSPDADGPWSRVDLPRPDGDTPTEAHAATCTPERCLAAGTAGGRLAVWEVRAGTATRVDGIPPVTVPERGVVLPPLTVGAGTVVVTSSDGGGTVLRGSHGRWTVVANTPGTPTSAVVRAAELWVVTTDAQGVGTLWRSRVA